MRELRSRSTRKSAPASLAASASANPRTPHADQPPGGIGLGRTRQHILARRNLRQSLRQPQRRHDRPIRGQQFHRLEFISGHPAQCLAVEPARLAAIAPHHPHIDQHLAVVVRMAHANQRAGRRDSVIPSSSRSSRANPARRSSPGSSLPPGNSQPPARCLPGGRWAMSTRPAASITAAATTWVGGLSTRVNRSLAAACRGSACTCARTRRDRAHCGPPWARL